MKYAKVIGAIVICLIGGALGGIATAGSVTDWYPTLVKPWFTPPDWLFGPAWTILYILMGISAGLIWIRKPQNTDTKIALTIFWIHLIVNILWSFTFFGAHSIGWGVVHILILWMMIIWVMRLFEQLSRPAFYLLIPYLLWVSFATALNAAIWQLN